MSPALQTTIKRILVKENSERNKRDLNTLVDHIKHTRFLKELKMKQKQLKKVAQALQYKDLKSCNYLIKYGQEGDDFFIILDGEVSVWVPVAPADIVKPLEKFKEKVKSAILTKSSELPSFGFHIEPFKIEKRPAYCSINDF